MLDRSLRNHIKKKRRDGEIRKHRLNEMGSPEYEMEKVKQTK